MLAKSQPRKLAANQRTPELTHKPKPFVEHIYELRQRLFWVVASVIAGSALGYVLQQSLIGWLLKPAHDQQFIYTSPGGGINFIFQISIYFGVIISIPVIMHQLLGYLAPLMRYHTKRFIMYCGVFSVLLAILGLGFGYFIGLPAALQFLTNQFKNEQITALLTIQEYMSFVTLYLIGAALMFQIPLIMLFINRIKPLKPIKLIKSERYVIVGAFVIAAVITPTPDIFNQALIAGPILAVYQLGIGLVWVQNRRNKIATITKLRQKDAEEQAKREARLRNTQLLATPTPALPNPAARHALTELQASPLRPTRLPVRPQNVAKRWVVGLDGISSIATSGRQTLHQA